jgi:hypothetical protein
MENTKISVAAALRRLKAGYSVYAFIDRRREDFQFQNGNILILSSNKSIRLNEYDFLELYRNQDFFLEEVSQEDTVDMKRDEEYYSWRQ